jgi:hypothetical protein
LRLLLLFLCSNVALKGILGLARSGCSRRRAHAGKRIPSRHGPDEGWRKREGEVREREERREIESLRRCRRRENREREREREDRKSI